MLCFLICHVCLTFICVFKAFMRSLIFHVCLTFLSFFNVFLIHMCVLRLQKVACVIIRQSLWFIFLFSFYCYYGLSSYFLFIVVIIVVVGIIISDGVFFPHWWSFNVFLCCYYSYYSPCYYFLLAFLFFHYSYYFFVLVLLFFVIQYQYNFIIVSISLFSKWSLTSFHDLVLSLHFTLS